MSYEQQNWVTGNRITAEKLNHMEQGISSAGGGTALIVNITVTQEDADTVFTLDKTWREIDAAYPNVVVVYSYGEHVEKSVPFNVTSASSSSLYDVGIGSFGGLFETNDADDYPRVVNGSGTV